MTNLEPRSHLVSLWGLTTGRGAIGAALASTGLGVIISLVGAVDGASRQDVATTSIIVGTLFGVILGMVTVHMALHKH